MTSIFCRVNKSGTLVPLEGFIRITATSYLASNTTFFVTDPVRYPLVAGVATFDLEPSDIAKVAYKIEIISVDPITAFEDTAWSFEAVVPFSASPLNLVQLAPQSGLRYDRRDASLLTLARYLASNSLFTDLLGGLLWSNKGLWDATTVYQRGNVVRRQGSCYQYISKLQQANLPPEANPTDWVLLVQGLAQ